MSTFNYRFSVLSLLLLSCTLMCEAKVVTSSKAATVANSFISKSTGMQKSLKLMEPRSRMQTPSQQPTAAPAYHIFIGADGKGFVIVAGDDVAQPILGYSPDATVTDATLPPAMQELLSDLEKQIRQAQDEGAEQTEEVARLWKSSSTGIGNVVVQLTTAKWNQNEPYNNQCPLDEGMRCPTGCGITAYAILMKYYGYPTQGWGVTDAYTTGTKNLSVSSRNLNHPYNWADMPLEYVSGQYNTTQANNVAQLMADIGSAFQADYTKDNTNSYVGQPQVFAHFGYNPGSAEERRFYSDSEWMAKLRAELDKERVVIYRGSNSDEEGHIFLLDGYTDKNYFAVNWGWGGNYNGFYTLTALAPGSFNYTSGQWACFDCVPYNESTTAKTVVIVDRTTVCPSLEAAVGLAQPGKPISIQLVSNTTMNSWIPIPEGKDVTIDLNGYSVTANKILSNRGKLTITDNTGNGKLSLVDINNAIINNYGDLTIDGGTYENTLASVSGTDYRRCVWSSASSKTYIKNGTFTNRFQVFCFNGEATIDQGVFNCTGTSSALSNYCKSGKVIINGGTFVNTGAKASSGSDYRRSVWTNADTETIINGGNFICNTTSQVVCINGKGTVNGGTITNKNTSAGIGCASGGNVAITNVQLSAYTLLWVFNDSATLQCSGGVYSKQVANNFLAYGCSCVKNDDFATMDTYPYKVYNPNATPTPKPGKRGDVNEDGVVDVADIATIIDIIAGKEE